ncbi:hypothetical protein [Aureimonas leprariae]|uniref:Uncharacterized protein n=1 Tax=Plantimonas leprariae TaxID=2615207 RepID=A0A7V7PQL4_9HYPH|nr:hypothetical protein [Aureimonas leprariae]KAB0680696.1 hypothetical protein F6X38_06725 [Aureimonas leprariae]
MTAPWLRWLSLFVGIGVGVSLFLGWKWYAYVTNTTSPYDEVGIELNNTVPQGMRDWGCARLQASFAGAVPPYGCAGPDGGWRVSPPGP